MNKKRRFLRGVSLLFLLLGAALLASVAFTLLRSWQAPEPLQRPVRSHTLDNLPPALVPVSEEFAESDPGPALAGAVLPQLAAPPAEEGQVLLPESPLIAKETLLYGGQDARTGLSAAQPQRLIIPALAIDAPILRASLELVEQGADDYYRWSVPDSYAAGWHETSALPGQPGNLVLNGHNNVYGSIFGDLVNLPVGEQIIVINDDGATVYRVEHHELLKELGASLRDRLAHARWIAPTEDERLTLVTCWPNTTNSHRLIVVAAPVGEQDGADANG